MFPGEPAGGEHPLHEGATVIEGDGYVTEVLQKIAVHIVLVLSPFLPVDLGLCSEEASGQRGTGLHGSYQEGCGCGFQLGHG